jgi:hypothetical protein
MGCRYVYTVFKRYGTKMLRPRVDLGEGESGAVNRRQEGHREGVYRRGVAATIDAMRAARKYLVPSPFFLDQIKRAKRRCHRDFSSSGSLWRELRPGEGANAGQPETARQ